MVQSTASTVEEYLDEMPDDRRVAIETVRDVILDNLPPGVEETMNWGMISYEIPLETFPDTYNAQPLAYAGLANQKRHMAVYLNTVYTSDGAEDWFRARYAETGKKLDMGKSCVRFTKLDNLPVELIGEAIARVTVDDFIGEYLRARG